MPNDDYYLKELKRLCNEYNLEHTRQNGLFQFSKVDAEGVTVEDMLDAVDDYELRTCKFRWQVDIMTTIDDLLRMKAMDTSTTKKSAQLQMELPDVIERMGKVQQHLITSARNIEIALNTTAFATTHKWTKWADERDLLYHNEQGSKEPVPGLLPTKSIVKTATKEGESKKTLAWHENAQVGPGQIRRDAKPPKTKRKQDGSGRRSPLNLSESSKECAVDKAVSRAARNAVIVKNIMKEPVVLPQSSPPLQDPPSSVHATLVKCCGSWGVTELDEIKISTPGTAEVSKENIPVLPPRDLPKQEITKWKMCPETGELISVQTVREVKIPAPKGAELLEEVASTSPPEDLQKRVNVTVSKMCLETE